MARASFEPQRAKNAKRIALEYRQPFTPTFPVSGTIDGRSIAHGGVRFFILASPSPNASSVNLLLVSMSTRCIFLASLSFALAVLAGCGSDGPTLIPIRGEVLYKGAPLRDVPQGLVNYLPKSADGPAGQRQNSAGRLVRADHLPERRWSHARRIPHRRDCLHDAAELSREQVEAAGGAGVGQPRLLIPEKYTDPNTSPLTDTVDSDHSGFKRIELTD